MCSVALLLILNLKLVYGKLRISLINACFKFEILATNLENKCADVCIDTEQFITYEICPKLLNFLQYELGLLFDILAL